MQSEREATEPKVVSRLRFEPLHTRRATDLGEAGNELTLAREAAEALRRQIQVIQQQHAEELDATRESTRLEMQAESEAELRKQIAREHEKISRTCAEFRTERTAYFANAESEAVKLALAIAARVLHREVKLDPMLLRAAAKVALGKVAEESGTLLRVPTTDVAAWQDWLQAEDLTAETQVVGDARLMVGECVLETRIGRVELGVSAQLEEIEKGFFDLLQQRPA